jgi:serine/threonine protein kinase
MTSQPDNAFRVGPESDPDRYSLGAAVGSGAEGILYRGSITTGTGVELEVAIKMLQPRFLDRVDEWHGRWMEQVELVRSLQVPGVVPVRDGFIGPMPHARRQPGEGRTLYLVMNWVDGEPVDEWVRHRPDRDPLDDLKVLVQVAAALDLMHSGRATGGVPVVHRDVKPSNILITQRGAVLVDFGLTRGLPTGQQLTGITGTPGYMSPEVLEEGLYSPASDRYALGAVAYFIVTGHDLPTKGRPEVIRDQLEGVAAISDQPDVVDHLMSMLDVDPRQRPTGLANWLGQVRNSSLLLRSESLTPPAPARQLEPSEKVAERGQRSHKPRRRTALLAVGILLVALASGGLLAAHWLSEPASTHQLSARFSGSFDPTCGQGQVVPLNPFLISASIPTAFAVAPSGSILAYNSSEVSPMQLEAFNPDCTLNEGFVAATANPSTNYEPFSISALTVAEHGRAIYAAGRDQGGWVIAKYQPSGALDSTFGKGGLVVHPEVGSGTTNPSGGWPTAIVATASRIFVVGTDGGSHADRRSLIVSLLPGGTPDPKFNATGTKGVLVSGISPGSSGQVVARAANGSLIVGGSYAGMGCGLFTIDEYTPSGEPVPSFKPVSLSGTGTNCGGKPRIPGYRATQLTSLITMPGGRFAAVGYAFSLLTNSVQKTSAGFIVRFNRDGAIDPSFGHNGVVMLPGLLETTGGIATTGISAPGASAMGAVAQPSGGFVVAMVKATGIYLLSVTSEGQVGRQVQLPTSPKPPPAIATGDAGDGKIEIMTFSLSQWSLGRYLGVSWPGVRPGG